MQKSFFWHWIVCFSNANSIRFWHPPSEGSQAPQVKGSVPQEGPHFWHQSQLGGEGWGGTHTSDPLAISKEFPWPFLRFHSLLEWALELRETLQLHLLICYKGYNSGTARKRCTEPGQGEGGKHRTFVPFRARRPWCVHQLRTSQTLTLGYIGMVDSAIVHWLLTSVPAALPSLKVRAGAERSPPLTRLVCLVHNPHPKAILRPQTPASH